MFLFNKAFLAKFCERKGLVAGEVHLQISFSYSAESCQLATDHATKAVKHSRGPFYYEV